MAFNCKECGKALIWLKNKETEKPAPIEAEETYYGNIFVKDGFYRVATQEEIQKARYIGKPLYLNHFASCPKADQFRKKK